MVIRSARTSDLPAIMSVIECARSRMRAEGNAGQWEGYPTEHTILDDISSGAFYVFVDDGSEVHGCFSLAAGPDPDYGDIDGAWIDDSPYGVIHRVATDNTFSHAMAQIVAFAKDQGFYHLRIDTNGHNVTMKAVLERLGFVCCGQLRRWREGPWVAYELSPQAPAAAQAASA
ncbi:GNAT family N-acetyltransferase [Olsenella sp. KGMB02461]|nr:GNAT family N-acetyltransferase [Olsenella sp. KGMB02461]